MFWRWKNIAILFSEVTVEGNGSEETFLVRGIPREYDDLQGWTAFEDFLLNIDQDTDILVHADAYLYGEGETFQATVEEVAYMVMRMDRDPGFLQSRCDHIENVKFTVQWSPEEIFGQSLTI